MKGRAAFHSSFIIPPSSLFIVVYDLGDGRKWYLDDLASGHFYLHARRSQCLCGLHAADDAAHAIAIRGDDLHVVPAVEWLECGEGFGHFHSFCTALSEAIFFWQPII
jgi:hypothetical protein